jgi:predicted nucleic acid-binding Zn ribbon protein
MLPIQSFSSSVLAGIIRRQPASKEKTRFAWQMVVGPAIARVTLVELDGGVLTVRCPDPRWSPELARARDVILSRLQHLLGRDVITRLTISNTPD